MFTRSRSVTAVEANVRHLNVSCRRLRPHALVVLASLPLGNPIALAAQESNADTRVASRAFSVIPPEGKGWAIAHSPDSLAVQFTHSKKGFLGVSSPEITTIEVYFDTTTADNAARGADSVAKDVMDHEEARLRAGTYKSSQQDVVLKSANRGTDSIGAYYLYVFEPSIQISNWQGRVQIDQRLYLYFPPDFETRRQFFLFLIAKEHPPKTMFEKKGFKEIRSVIASFRDERPPAS